MALEDEHEAVPFPVALFDDKLGGIVLGILFDRLTDQIHVHGSAFGSIRSIESAALPRRPSHGSFLDRLDAGQISDRNDSRGIEVGPFPGRQLDRASRVS